MLGIYGQNGSGKTAFIEALWILKMVLLGESLPGDIKDNIYQVCFQHNDSERIKGGDLAIALSEPTTVPERVLSTVKNVIENLNIVLKEIISDLTIKIKEYGEELDENEEEVYERTEKPRIARSFKTDRIK
ncbi:AAA family ATPase [Halanaerobium congolense]|uniref:Rad50/SbcC-type AAA domain-containing protein n=1 Tax=Halanaerobium congolense TaxID=54121 RepID=A0A1M7PME4_9FIRM|nr:AAA family ATPase [Halanaerobium congolense]PXV58886.1 hypothetical protein C8C78_1901 [Halanaerobium congolense]TDX35414.1 hypothetical protein C7954_1631 [Halanaerobium congolense]SHN18406.1 hypothetical protein SAMN04515650_1449 [Halanaerobium congolense]